MQNTDIMSLIKQDPDHGADNQPNLFLFPRTLGQDQEAVSEEDEGLDDDE